jgi:hypothetical protein
MSFAGTYTGMLIANQALLAATGQKDQINWNDPSQSDWLAFKGGGFKWGIPGAAHTEIKLIGQILAAQVMKPEDLAAVGIKGTKGATGGKLTSLREEYAWRQAREYLESKATPAYGLGKELITGQDFMDRPLSFLPWSPKGKVDPKHPPISLGEFAWSRAPIPLSSAAGYVYDQLRKAGASVTDASMWMRAIMVGSASAFAGTDPKPIKDPTPHRTRGQVQVGH